VTCWVLIAQKENTAPQPDVMEPHMQPHIQSVYSGDGAVVCMDVLPCRLDQDGIYWDVLLKTGTPRFLGLLVHAGETKSARECTKICLSMMPPTSQCTGMLSVLTMLRLPSGARAHHNLCSIATVVSSRPVTDPLWNDTVAHTLYCCPRCRC
jgi:hypothetical protein